MVIEECQDVEELRVLGEAWLQELNAEEYGLDVDLDVIIEDLKSWMQGEGVVLVGKQDDEIIGGMALFVVPSYLGNQRIALEKYWYAKKGGRVAGPKLYVEAVNWARRHNCSHLIAGGSRMGSDRHDSICKFLEKTGAKHFETSYIYEL